MENASGTRPATDAIYQDAACGDVNALDSMLRHVLADTPIDTLALFWRPLDTLTHVAQPDSSLDAGWLRQRLRRALWPWLLGEDPQTATDILSVPTELSAKSGNTGLAVSAVSHTAALAYDVAPLHDSRGQLQGMLVIATPVVDLQPWRSRLLVDIQNLRHVLCESVDATSGLLSAPAFVASVDRWSQDARHVNSCLLECRVSAIDTPCPDPAAASALESLPEALDLSPADRALLEADLIALCQLRIRSRDLCGKSGPQRFSIVLKSCTPENAERVAREIEANAEGYALHTRGRSVAGSIHCTVHPLNAREPAKHVESIIESAVAMTPIGPETVPTADDGHVIPPATPAPAMAPSNVVRLPRREESEGTSVDSTFADINPEEENDAAGQGWRLLPGIAVDDNRRVECYQLARFGAVASSTLQPDGVKEDYPRFVSVVDTLQALGSAQSAPVIMVDISAMHLSETFGEWLLARCADRHVPPSSVCLAIAESELQSHLAAAVSALVRFNRLGFRLGLQYGSGTARRIDPLLRIAFDYAVVTREWLTQPQGHDVASAGVDSPEPNGRTVIDPLQSVRLESGIDPRVLHVRRRGARLICRGVDNEQQLRECRWLGADVAFGQACGRSVLLNSLSEQG